MVLSGPSKCYMDVPYRTAWNLFDGENTENTKEMGVFTDSNYCCCSGNDYKFGKRIVGMTNSANSFGSKIGSGIGASLIGWLLAAAGYNAALEVQPASVDTAIFAFGIYIPLVLFVIMFILLLKNDLEKRYPEIVAELQKRKEAK